MVTVSGGGTLVYKKGAMYRIIIISYSMFRDDDEKGEGDIILFAIPVFFYLPPKSELALRGLLETV